MYVYLEGGNHLRKSMKSFLRRAVNRNLLLEVVTCGSGERAASKCSNDSNAVLLIDSEGTDLNTLGNRVRAQIGRTNHAFFMVQLMEAWFLADRPTLTTYYGQQFNVSSLPANPSREDIPKRDVENGLRNATRNTSQGVYAKTGHAPELLEQLDPARVYDACPNFARLVDYLRQQSA